MTHTLCDSTITNSSHFPPKIPLCNTEDETAPFLLAHKMISFLLSCLKVLVTQSCRTLCDPVHCSPPGSPVHGILQARILEWVAIPFSRGSSRPKDWTLVSHIAGRFFEPGIVVSVWNPFWAVDREGQQKLWGLGENVIYSLFLFVGVDVLIVDFVF